MTLWVIRRNNFGWLFRGLYINLQRSSQNETPELQRPQHEEGILLRLREFLQLRGQSLVQHGLPHLEDRGLEV